MAYPLPREEEVLLSLEESKEGQLQRGDTQSLVCSSLHVWTPPAPGDQLVSGVSPLVPPRGCLEEGELVTGSSVVFSPLKWLVDSVVQQPVATGSSQGPIPGSNQQLIAGSNQQPLPVVVASEEERPSGPKGQLVLHHYVVPLIAVRGRELFTQLDIDPASINHFWMKSRGNSAHFCSSMFRHMAVTAPGTLASWDGILCAVSRVFEDGEFTEFLASQIKTSLLAQSDPSPANLDPQPAI